MRSWHTTDFYNYLSFQKRYSAHTCSSYKTDLEQFIQYLDEHYCDEQGVPQINSLAEVEAPIIRSYIHFLLSKENNAAITVHHKISSLKTYYKYLLRQGLVSKDPFGAIILPKKAKRLPSFIDESQMRLLKEPENLEDERISAYEKLLHTLIIELLYQTGIRRAELLSLKQADIDLYKNTLKVYGKRAKERYVPFGGELNALLSEFILEKENLQLPEDFLFYREDGKRLDTNSLSKIVRSKLASATTLKKKSPHVLRHSFATHLLNSGAEINTVKELLGHSSLAATQVYTHNSIEKLKKAYKQAHPRA